MMAYLGHGKTQILLIRLGKILIHLGRLCILPRWITAYSTRVDYVQHILPKQITILSGQATIPPKRTSHYFALAE